MANFDGQKIEFMDADGKRRRFTVGSPEFKEWFDKTFTYILSVNERLENLKASVKEVYGQLQRPINKTTGVTVKSGTIKGNMLAGKFDVKSAYELIDNTAMEDGACRTQQAMLKAVCDLFGNEFVATEYKTKESFHKVTEKENFATLGIDFKQGETIQPSWKPTMLMSIVGKETETESEVKAK